MSNRVEISFGKVDGYKIGKRNCEVTLEVELRKDKEGRPVFSACGNLWNNLHTDIIWGGQCIDDLANEFPSLRRNKLYMEILDLWKKHHLNDMNAGTPEQEEAVEWYRKHNGSYDYTKVCDYLKEKGLYEVDLNGEKYRYGSSWLYREIPEGDLRRIMEIVGEQEITEMLENMGDLRRNGKN